ARRGRAWVCTAAILAGFLAGCVERRYVITTDPPGALVLQNGQPIGAAPADNHFEFYGDYGFTLIKDGYATMSVVQHIPRPWYEYFPLEPVSEILIPWRIYDVRRFHYKLEPLQMPRTDDLLNRAGQIRDRGQHIGAPPPTPPQLKSGSPP